MTELLSPQAGPTARPASGPPPQVSILVISWNTLEKTRRCLESLPDAVTDGLPYEVIVVDNGSTDGSARMLQARRDIRLLRNDRNLGYAKAVNQAYAQAVGKLILLLNSDVRCQPGALSTMVAFLRRHPEAAGVAPHYLDHTGRAQPHHLALPSFRAAIGVATGARLLPGFRKAWRTYQMHGVDFSRAQPVDQPAASCLLLRREVLPRTQLLDETYPLYFNDVRFAQQLAANGHRLWTIPDSTVVHDRGSSGALLDPAVRTRHYVSGLIRYVAQTQPRHRLLLLQALTLLDRPLRRILRNPGQLGVRDVLAALRGDPGPLPGQ